MLILVVSAFCGYLASANFQNLQSLSIKLLNITSRSNLAKFACVLLLLITVFSIVCIIYLNPEVEKFILRILVGFVLGYFTHSWFQNGKFTYPKVIMLMIFILAGVGTTEGEKILKELGLTKFETPWFSLSWPNVPDASFVPDATFVPLLGDLDDNVGAYHTVVLSEHWEVIMMEDLEYMNVIGGSSPALETLIEPLRPIQSLLLSINRLNEAHINERVYVNHNLKLIALNYYQLQKIYDEEKKKKKKQNFMVKDYAMEMTANLNGAMSMTCSYSSISANYSGNGSVNKLACRRISDNPKLYGSCSANLHTTDSDENHIYFTHGCMIKLVENFNKHYGDYPYGAIALSTIFDYIGDRQVALEILIDWISNYRKNPDVPVGQKNRFLTRAYSIIVRLSAFRDHKNRFEILNSYIEVIGATIAKMTEKKSMNSSDCLQDYVDDKLDERSIDLLKGLIWRRLTTKNNFAYKVATEISDQDLILNYQNNLLMQSDEYSKEIVKHKLSRCFPEWFNRRGDAIKITRASFLDTRGTTIIKKAEFEYSRKLIKHKEYISSLKEARSKFLEAQRLVIDKSNLELNRLLPEKLERLQAILNP